MKIKNYMVVMGYSTDEIKASVEQLIREGWQPHGGVGFSTENSRWTFAQAMVKHHRLASSNPTLKKDQ